MTEQPQDTTPPAGEPMADEPVPDAPDEGAEAGAGGKAREWLTQLEAMIQDIATQAAPVARQVGAKAAELAAVAAVKAGPIAHKAADVTTDVGQRFAERAQSVAAELRAVDHPDAAGAPAAEAPAETVPDPAPTGDEAPTA
jgi:hypothetical protein